MLAGTDDHLTWLSHVILNLESTYLESEIQVCCIACILTSPYIYITSTNKAIGTTLSSALPTENLIVHASKVNQDLYTLFTLWLIIYFSVSLSHLVS